VKLLNKGCDFDNIGLEGTLISSTDWLATVAIPAFGLKPKFNISWPLKNLKVLQRPEPAKPVEEESKPAGARAKAAGMLGKFGKAQLGLAQATVDANKRIAANTANTYTRSPAEVAATPFVGAPPAVETSKPSKPDGEPQSTEETSKPDGASIGH
jgi:hypothetical protein